MTTINDIADLVRVLRENPEWLDTLRGVLISDELSSIPGSLKEIDRRLGGLETELAGIKAEMGDVKTELTTVGGKVSNLTGDDYESFAGRFAPRRMDLPGDVISVTLAYQYRTHNPLWLTELATIAMLQGDISREEADDLNDLDLVFTIAHRDSETRLVAAEVSIRVDSHDVERADRHADILARTQPLAVTPVTIGEGITDAAVTLGTQLGVTYVHLQQTPRE